MHHRRIHSSIICTTITTMSEQSSFSTNNFANALFAAFVPLCKPTMKKKKKRWNDLPFCFRLSFDILIDCHQKNLRYGVMNMIQKNNTPIESDLKQWNCCSFASSRTSLVSFVLTIIVIVIVISFSNSYYIINFLALSLCLSLWRNSHSLICVLYKQ
jgi:hypothetical protein